MLGWMFSVCAVAAGQQVLFVGNSYTAFNGLHERVAENVTADAVWDPFTVEAITTGGYTLPRHLADAETPGRPLHEALVSGGMVWDTVVLQDQSQIPAFPEDVPDKAASLEAVVALDALVAGAGGQTLLFQTWGRRDGDALNPELFPDYPTMQDALTDGYWAYHGAIESTGRRAWIAPVGEAWRLVWGDVLASGGDPGSPESDFHRLYSGDGSHPSPYGSFLVAAVFHAALSGHDPQGNAVQEELEDERYRAYLQEVAARAVLAEPYAFPLPWALDIPDVTDTVSDPAMRLQVRVATTAARDALAVGVEHDGESGYGHLWVTAGGDLTVGTLTVGAGGEGLLVVEGGVLTVTTASTMGSGQLEQSGGEVTIGAGVLPPVMLTGGALTGAFEVSGDLTQTGGRLAPTEGGALTVSGSAVLEGALDVTAVTGESQVVLTASTLVDGGFERVMRADQEVVVDEAAGTITVLSSGTVSDTGTSATPTPGTLTDTSSGIDTGTVPWDTGMVCKEKCDGFCGCSASGGLAGGWLGLLGVGLVLRRRRS